MAPIHFNIKPPFSELSPLSRKIFGTLQVTQFLEGPTSPASLIRGGVGGGGGLNCACMVILLLYACVVLILIICIFEEGTSKIVAKVTQDKMAVLHLYHFVKWKYFQLFKQRFSLGKLIIECNYSNSFSLQFDNFIYYLTFLLSPYLRTI